MDRQQLNLTIRPATSSDREPVLDWCHVVWHPDRDYLEWVWDAWQADGSLLVAEMAGFAVPIAVIRINQLSVDEAWFGALRVHADAQGTGVGTWMINFAEQWARDRHCSTLGYMTSITNQTMHKMADKFGYRIIGTIEWHTCALEAQTCSIEHTSDWIDLAQSQQLHAQQGYYTWSWAIQVFTPEVLAQHAENQELFALPDHSAWIIVEDGHEDVYYLAFAEGEPDGIKQLIQHVLTLPHVGSIQIPIWLNTPISNSLEVLQASPTDDNYRLMLKNLNNKPTDFDP